MPARRSHALLAVVCLVLLATGGCTLVKPVVGAVVGPVVVLAGSDGYLGGCGCDARGAVAVLAVSSAVGALIGLVTGIISDVQALNGTAHDPTANWWHPLKTNTSD